MRIRKNNKSQENAAARPGAHRADVTEATVDKHKNKNEDVNELETDAPLSRGSEESLDKVRDLLFGSQVREQQTEISRLEHKVVDESAQMREHVNSRVASIEKLITTKLELLEQRIANEVEQRKVASDDLVKQMTDLTETLDAKAVEIEEKSGRADGELRSLLLSQGNLLSTAIKQRNEEVVTTFTERFERLEADKADSGKLADLLVEIGTRLQGK